MFLDYSNLDILSGDHAFDCVYMDAFPVTVREACVMLSEKDCNVFNLIDQFFCSHIFRRLNCGTSPIILNLSAKQLVRDFYLDDNPIEIPYSSKEEKEDVEWIDEDVIRWAGEHLAFLFWRYNPKMNDFIKVLSFKDVCDRFYPLHECGTIAAVRKLWAKYANTRGLPVYD